MRDTEKIAIGQMTILLVTTALEDSLGDLDMRQKDKLFMNLWQMVMVLGLLAMAMQ